jgi:hypothetical protein
VIESTLITWLTSAPQTTAGARVYTGSRLQSSTLPALVVEVPDGATATVGASIDRYTVVIRAVCETMADAQTLAAAAVVKLRTSAAAANAQHVVLEDQYPMLDEPVVGEGDETEPAICSSNLTLYLKV